MKIEKIPCDPGTAMDFYEEGLRALGALCDRTWHDRMEILAEKKAATLWGAEGDLHSTELRFCGVDTVTARDASSEIFPGCPLTFRLAESLRPVPLPLDKVVLSDLVKPGAPELTVAEKLWRAQYPETTRWKPLEPFKSAFHFSLVALVRMEIQAIDQHWSLHRISTALPNGEVDHHLAAEFPSIEVNGATLASVPWPLIKAGKLTEWLQKACLLDLANDLKSIQERQEKSLRRELDRVDDYFEQYEKELNARANKSSNANSKNKTADRLTAAKAEHIRRREDQTARHEVRILPHFDALILVAENAWKTALQIDRNHQTEKVNVTFVPRSRKWHLA